MPVKRWNTMRAALIGAVCGIVYAVVRIVLGSGPWTTDQLSYHFGGLIGGAVGGAALFAAVSGVRNLILRK